MSIPFAKLSKEPLPDPCQCRACDGDCPRKIRKNWRQCRPCTKGYHWAPCEAYTADRYPLIVPECDECGWHQEEH